MDGSPSSDEQLDRVLREGCQYVVGALGLGTPEDLERIESGGRLAAPTLPPSPPGPGSAVATSWALWEGATTSSRSRRWKRSSTTRPPRRLGLFAGQMTILIHTGSRGLGHQVCTDAVRTMDASLERYGIDAARIVSWPARRSPLRRGRSYFAAMCAAANFAWSNRQVLTHRVRTVRRADPRRRGDARTGAGLRRGAQYRQARGARRPASLRPPEGSHPRLRPGQPRAAGALPGRGSAGLRPREHGDADLRAGGDGRLGRGLVRQLLPRRRPRAQPPRCEAAVEGHVLRKELESQGIVVRCPSNAELAEEAPLAYKDVERVVDVVTRAGIAHKVVRLRPWGVLKG